MTQRIVTTVADSGAGSLRSAIAQAKWGDIVAFAPALVGQTIALERHLEIPAGKRLTIDGSGAPGITLSGGGQHRIMYINSSQNAPSNVVLRNLTLANGYTPGRGGAVQVAHRGALTVGNVQFRNNVADEGGGAIFTNFEGQLTVLGSRFIGNRATAGNNERGAGAIAFWGPNKLLVRNSLFTGNAGINGGAINSLNGQLIIENSRFLNNQTLAARYDTGNARPSLRGYGGAIYTDRASSKSDTTSGNIVVRNSLFGGNRGRGEGGALYLYTGAQDRVVVTNSRFGNNRVISLPNGGNNGNGGAIAHLSDGLNRGFIVNNTLFAGNTATDQGGGIWTMDAPTRITNSTFSRNRTLGQRPSSIGGGLALYSPTDIVGSIFANNRAGWVGGALSASGDDRVTVRSTIFANNVADNGPNNWGIQQHTNRELIDLGSNFQYPPKQTNNFNDYNATATIRTDINPQLILQPDGTYIVANPVISRQLPLVGVSSAKEFTASDDTGDRLNIQVGNDAHKDSLLGNSGADSLVGDQGDPLLSSSSRFEQHWVILQSGGNDRSLSIHLTNDSTYKQWDKLYDSSHNLEQRQGLGSLPPTDIFSPLLVNSAATDVNGPLNNFVGSTAINREHDLT